MRLLHAFALRIIAHLMLPLIPINAIVNNDASQQPQMRGSNSNSNSNHQRIHRIRRLYGEENSSARRELDAIQQKSTDYWQTGIRGDPSFKIPYSNHPFDLMEQARVRRRRHLSIHAPHLTPEETETEVNRNLQSEIGDSLEGGVTYNPMRIKLITTSLETQRTSAENGQKVDFIMQKILPRMSDFWRDALSVVPVAGNLVIQINELASRKFCGDSEFTEVPPSHFTDGVADADLILYVSGQPSTRFCGPSTLAVAVACNFDQFDRPTAGAINFCLNQVTLDEDGSAHEATISDNVDVAIHEAAHVLGMSSNSYRYFWDPESGLPRTPRGFVSQTVTCVDGEERSLFLPDENTLLFEEAENGQRYATIVTKTVRTVARNQFDCQSLSGGQLENQPTGSGSCTGDHWDERMYYPEALSGVISSATNILSPITLALLEDSGWYKANFTKSKVSPWGHGVGCDFVNKPCLVTQGSETIVPDYGRGFFCTKSSGRGCSASHDYKMGCTVIDYSLFYSQNSPEAKFQYFQNDPALGGPRQADYCPLYGSTYKSNIREHDCRNPENGDGLGLFSEYYGDNSLCVETTSGEGRCYESKCIKDDHLVLIKVRGVYHECISDFQSISVKTSDLGVLPVTITCPRLASACPDMFCPANCAGRGICNFNSQINGTTRPRCLCFNESDTSPGCAETLTLEDRYLNDSDDLVSKLDRTIFDPLIAVFVDEPNTWTSASWAWASGLFALFLLVIICICSSCMPSRRKRGKRVRRSDDDDKW